MEGEMSKKKTRGRQRRVGPGRSVAVFNLPNGSTLIRLMRPLDAEDVENGKLVPVVNESVRRGGKRVTLLSISPDAEEALMEILTARKQKRILDSRLLTNLSAVMRLLVRAVA